MAEFSLRFRSGDINLADAARSGRPSTTDDNQILTSIKVDRHLMTREIAERFNIAHTSFAAIKMTWDDLVCSEIGKLSCTSSCFHVIRLSTPRNTALN